MSTITKELAKLFRKITNSEIDAEGNAHVVLSPADSLLINNARIALASLEAEKCAEPVAFINGAWTLVYYRPPKELGLKIGDKLYTAPPAPVSVPAAMEMDDDFDSAFEHGKAVGWNACRAAMLQGADGALTDEDAKRVDELVMWIKRLAHSLRKANPDSKLQSDAMDYLSRKGLIGVEDILR